MIGRFFGRDHTTVVYAVEKFEELSARLAVLEGLTAGYKDFIDYLKGAHPEVFVEYIESRKASDRLTS